MATTRALSALRRTSIQTAAVHCRCGLRYASSGRPGARPKGRRRMFGMLAVAGLASGAVFAYPLLSPQPEPVQTPKAEIMFEKQRRQTASKEDNRELISSQHVQVKRSWEKPGVYAWGSNEGKVVAPDSDEKVIKTPRRIACFDGQVFRDLKLNCNFGAAISENGDLVQWGTAFSPTKWSPAITLKGRDLVKLAISRDRIIALASNGSVYSVPASSSDQTSEEQSSWLPFWAGSSSSVKPRLLTPQNLGWGEKVVDVSSGLEHCLLLTSKGRVFSAAASVDSFPSRGQMGLPALSWANRPEGPYDQPHEVTTLRGFKIKQIATGDLHSLVLDEDGKVFAFGDNSAGQLGVEMDHEFPAVDAPVLLPLQKLYKGTGMRPKVSAIAAGGSNSFFCIDATKKLEDDAQSKKSPKNLAAPARNQDVVVADVWACGDGLYGSLGNGRWTHISYAPTKIRALSNLFEWDELTNRSRPIRIAHLAVGATHTSAILDNVTNLAASHKTSEHDTNWGADVMLWGGNEHYQLGTGKRSNINAPVYIAPLDSAGYEGNKKGAHRFQLTPRKTVRLGEDGKGRKVSVEQRMVCGRHVTAVYSGC